MTELQIRATTADDVDIWRALRLDGIARHPEAFMLSLEAARAIPAEKDAAALDRLNRWLAFLDDEPVGFVGLHPNTCLLYTSPSPRDQRGSRMPSSA